MILSSARVDRPCSSSLKSPQILELSGIGNPNILRKLGISTKVDLPGVGTNVQEHMIVGVSFGTFNVAFEKDTIYCVALELRDDVPFDTLDLLADPATAAKHLELQCVP